MQLEIDQLKRELRHARRKQASLNSGASSDDKWDVNYRQRSRTPPSKSFSYEEEHHREQWFRSLSRRGVGNDAMSKALNKISRLPFMRKIEEARLPQHFHQPTFTIYNGRTDPVEHVSHFNQRMAVHSKDEALMLSMQEGETLKTYSDRYWEMFNKMDGNFDEVAISTFKLSLPTEHNLRNFLIGLPVTSVRQLMEMIDKYKRVEEDQQQRKGKDKFIPQERRDFRSDRYSNNKPRRDFIGQSGLANLQVVNVVFQKPVH
ncbi:uncharacterized protein LOC136071066 [Quercus suber]|uniref:uncharacterized protein LOC136071066 n=1 Tax=Quercus suber TaxID=58331 RepID=UPI0032DE50E7